MPKTTKHKKKIGDEAFQKKLEMAGLGEMRFLQELGKRYEATETKFYKGMAIAYVEDNATRMAATNLHANLLGKLKSQVEHSGTIVVQFDKDFEGV